MKWRNEAPWMAGVGLAVLALYLWTMPRTVMLEDDGLFLMAATHWGVAHPPGYPLFTLLAHGFTQLPLGTVAFRGHLASAVLGAGACVALYLMVRGLVPHRLPALLAALAFGTSEHFWSQAIIAEVYTLNALTALGGYALVLEASRAQETQVRKCLLAAAVVFGLGLANHWPLMVLAFPGMLVAVLPVWRIVLRTLPWLAATTLLAAGFPYGLMAWRSQANPETSFYGPIESWAEFWFYVSRQGYTSADFSPSAGWSDKLRFMADFAGEVWGQYTPVGALLALLGLLWLLRNQRWTVALSGLLIFLGNSIALFAIIGFDHDFLNEAVVRPYPLVSYGVQALWMGLGAGWFFRQAQVRWPEHSRKLVVGGAVLGVGLLGFIVPMNWNANDRSEDRFADTHGRMLLESLAPDAVLFVYGDAETGPLGYLNCVEGVRADVTLISLQGLVYHDRLFPPRAPKRVKQEELLWFIGSTSRPVYYTVEEELLPHGRGVRHFGFVKRIERQGIPAELQMTLNARGVNYFKELHAMPTSPDRWVQFRRNKLLYLYGGFLGYAVLSRNDVLLERTRLLVQLAEQNYYSLTGMIEVLMKHGSTPHWSQVQEWLNRSEQLKDETLDKERNGRHHYLRGFLAYQLGDWERAKQEFRKSVEWYNHPENSAKAALEKLEEGG